MRQAFELSIDREAINQVVFNGEYVPATSGSPRPTPISAGLPGAQARRRQGQGAAQGGRRHRRRSRSTSWCPTSPSRQPVAEVIQSMAAEAGFDLKIRDRVRDLAQAGRGGRLPGSSCRLERPRRSRRQLLLLPHLRRAAERRQATATRTSTTRSTRRAPRAIRPSARRSTSRSRRSSCAEGSIIYLYHRQVLIALTTR